MFLRQDTSVGPYRILVRRFVGQLSCDWLPIGMSCADSLPIGANLVSVVVAEGCAEGACVGSPFHSF